MANNLLTIGMITRESLRVLESMLPFTKNVNKQYSDQFARDGAKIGDSLNIRKPPRYVGRDGPLLQVENSVESTIPLTLSQAGCDISFSTKDMTLSIDDFRERFLVSAMSTVAGKIELAGMQQYQNVYNVVGTPGVLPTASTLGTANALLDASLAPMDGRRTVILEPYATANLVQDTKGLFQDSGTIAEQYESGRFARGFGFNAYTGQMIPSHTAGIQGGTPLVNGAGQSGNALVTDGWTAAAATRLKKGDTFTIAGVFAVNLQSRQSTGKLQSFVVTSDAASDGSGNMTVQISPAIVTSGQFQTVDSAPADNAAITVTSGTSGQVSKQNLAFHPDAFTFATADMVLPDGVWMADRVVSRTSGISMRAVRAYDITTDQAPLRLDVLFGWATTRPELAVRIEG
jgi:hypothetical protein